MCLAALHQLLACMQRHAEEIQPPFVRDIRREAPEIFHLVKSGVGTLSRLLREILDEGRRAGIFRKDFQARLMIEILLGTMKRS